MTAIQQWVEQGKAPETMIASRIAEKGTVDRTRPLCRYPQCREVQRIGQHRRRCEFHLRDAVVGKSQIMQGRSWLSVR